MPDKLFGRFEIEPFTTVTEDQVREAVKKALVSLGDIKKFYVGGSDDNPPPGH